MTWYADHLFADPSRSLIDQFLADPVLANHVYRVDNLADFDWHDSKVKHDLGPKGLLVVRPICDPHSHRAEWYGQDFVSWLDVDSLESVELHVAPSLLQGDSPDYDLSDYPPLSFLKYIKQLSKGHGATLAFYHCSMWGGDTDIEYAWIFRNGVEFAYSGSHFRDFPNIVTEFHPNSPKIETKGFVLVKTLANFSIDLPTPYFALHTRSFPWDAKKISSQMSA